MGELCDRIGCGAERMWDLPGSGFRGGWSCTRSRSGAGRSLPPMNDILIGLVFVVILISPAIVAAYSGKSSELNQ